MQNNMAAKPGFIVKLYANVEVLVTDFIECALLNNNDMPENDATKDSNANG